MSAEPVVVERPLEARDACLILASDGLWDVVSSRKAVAIARALHPDADAAARALCTLATRRWKRESGNYRGDIRCRTVSKAGLRALFC